MRHKHTYVCLCLFREREGRLFQLIWGVIFEMDETGVPTKTSDLPYITDKCYQYIYIYRIKPLVEFYNRNLFQKKKQFGSHIET